jgi:serine/threonine-protein kinase
MVGFPPSNVGDGAPLVRTGDIVSGKFRIERVLGQGGMGVVVAARHLQLDETVALKFLRAHATSDPDALARFTREARAAAKLKSEHVARVLDAAVADDGTPYIVMEYLEGRTLGRVLEDQGRLDVATTAEYAIQACEGLAEAHARGIVHRDIKPENLFLVERSQGWRVVKILDFGISKFDVARTASDANISTQSMMGSPCYMSPEQLRSTASVDHRTDIWSLGATIFELLTGGTAYKAGQTLPQLITAILEEPTPRLIDVRPDVPADLSTVVARCMAKDRGQRYGSAAELALALLPFAPKRVRANVERAIAVTQATAPSSDAVRLWSDTPPSEGPAASRPPSIPVSGTLRSATSGKGQQGIENLDTLAAPTKPVSQERAGSRVPRAALAIAVAGVLTVVAWRLAVREPSPAPPPRESSLPSAAARVDPVALPVATPAAAAVPSDLPSPEPARVPPAPSATGSAAVHPYRPAPAGASSHLPAAPSASSPRSNLDIRMER